MSFNKIHTDRIMKSIKEEMSMILSGNLANTASIDNPIEFENDLAKFKYQGNDRLLVQPKKGVEYLVLNFKVLPSGTEFEDL